MASTDAASRLITLVRQPAVDAAEIRTFLDRLALPERIEAVRGLAGTKLQRAVWNAAGVNPPITVNDLIPRDYPAMKPVVFHGKNSLPAFSHFRKICLRPRAAELTDVLWGYNETSIRAFIGPGYYVVHDTPGHSLGGTAFDYRQVPEERLPSWPEIRSNDVGLSRFIYNGTVDFMRRVASEVFIGSATRRDRELGSFFVLARELG